MNRLATLLLMAVVGGAAAAARDFDSSLLTIQQDWAEANYEVTGAEAKDKAFEALDARAAALVSDYPDRAEALIWQGIVYSTHAGAKSGLGALGLAKKARASLEAAMAIDDMALGGSAYTSLGTLYHKVPGFPIGFGSDKKAEKMLTRALQINPVGIDPNYFYGEFLYDEGEYTDAMIYLQRARSAPPRSGRELADQGRRQECDALLARIRERLGEG